MPRLLRINDAAEYLGVSPDTLKRLVDEGQIVPIRTSRFIFYTQEILDAFCRGPAGNTDVGMPSDKTLRVSVTVQQKITYRQYESAEVSMTVSGVTMDTTDDEIAALVDQGHLTYKAMGQRIKGSVARLRRENGYEHFYEGGKVPNAQTGRTGSSG